MEEDSDQEMMETASSSTTSFAAAAMNPRQPSPSATGQVEDTSHITPAISAQQLSAHYRQAEVSSMDSLLDPLPTDWTRHQSKSHPGLCYYYNEQTGENIWSRPVSDGLEASEIKIAKSTTEIPKTNTANLPCSPEEISWYFGCMIGQIFNPDPHYDNLNLSALSNIQENVRGFYRKCLHKNPKKRPSIDMLRAFLVQGSQYGEDEEFAGGVGGGSGQLPEPQEMEAQPQQLAGVVGGCQSVQLQQGGGGGSQLIGPEWGGVGGQQEPGKDEVRFVDTSENEKKLCHRESVEDLDQDDGNAGVSESPIKHMCPLCKNWYSRRQHLKRHVEAAHASILDELLPKTKKQFQCDECSKSYNRVNSLKRHLFLHRSKEKKNMKKKPASSKHELVSNKSQYQAPLCAYEAIRRNNILEKEEMFKALEIEKAKDLLLK